MNTNYWVAYLLIIGSIVVWPLVVPRGRKVSDGVVGAISIFGGAFLFASCFINLIPHIYVDGFTTPQLHIKTGVFVLAGFLLQTVIEHFTNGIEHTHTASNEYNLPVAGLMAGLCLHAFIEGMPLTDSNGDIHQALLYGIVLHNIPIAIILTSLFASQQTHRGKTLLLMTLFAVMTPLGSIVGNTIIAQGNTTVQSMLMALVVGILMHVSVSILFGSNGKEFRWWKILLIMVAFAAAYLTPGCPEIYPH